MIAFLLPLGFASLALVSGIALIDSALRWWSAFRRLYPMAGAEVVPDRGKVRRTATPRHYASATSCKPARAPGFTRAAA